MKKVLIFGINGYLGGLSTTALHYAGIEVDGVGTTTHVDKNLENITNNYFQIKHRIAEMDLILHDYSHIIFCISLDHNKSEIDFKQSFEINCGILADLIQATNLKSLSTQIIYLSTMQVYKDSNFESNIIDPKNIYGLSHLFCEQLLKLYGNAIILRLSNVYGPPQTERANIGWTLIADLCNSITKYSSMEIKNDGTAIRNFIFSEDFQELITNLVSNSNYGYLIYDLIGKTTSSVGNIKRILQSIAIENGKKITITVPKNYIVESEEYLINTAFSLKQNVKKSFLVGNTELFEGLKKTIKYYEES